MDGWPRGYMGLAATTWIPMGAGAPARSPNDHPDPSQRRQEVVGKKQTFENVQPIRATLPCLASKNSYSVRPLSSGKARLATTYNGASEGCRPEGCVHWGLRRSDVLSGQTPPPPTHTFGRGLRSFCRPSPTVLLQPRPSSPCPPVLCIAIDRHLRVARACAGGPLATAHAPSLVRGRTPRLPPPATTAFRPPPFPVTHAVPFQVSPGHSNTHLARGRSPSTTSCATQGMWYPRETISQFSSQCTPTQQFVFLGVAYLSPMHDYRPPRPWPRDSGVYPPPFGHASALPSANSHILPLKGMI